MVRVKVTGGYVSEHGGRKRVGPRPNQAQRAQIRHEDRAERRRYENAAGNVILIAMLRHKLRRMQATLLAAQRRHAAAATIQAAIRRRNVARKELDDIIDLT